MPRRIKIRDIPSLLKRYEYPRKEDGVVARWARIRKQKKLNLDDLYAICDWKAPRAAKHSRKNENEEVEEVTSLALRSNAERIRIETLQILHGVSYPTASVILHFFHSDEYPILDFRALWSLGIAKPVRYTFRFWKIYVEQCRLFYKEVRQIYPDLTIREIDRALWQYSKENQKTG